MSHHQSTKTGAEGADTTNDLTNAALAGILAGIVFGLLIQFVIQRMPAIGALYTLGEPSLTVGWVAHFAHSAIFGVAFGVVSWWAPVAKRTTSAVGSSLAGAGYGATLWLVNIVFIWPLWLNAVGVEMLPFPYLASVRPLFGHLLWGGLMGALYWGLQRQ